MYRKKGNNWILFYILSLPHYFFVVVVEMALGAANKLTWKFVGPLAVVVNNSNDPRKVLASAYHIYPFPFLSLLLYYSNSNIPDRKRTKKIAPPPWISTIVIGINSNFTKASEINCSNAYFFFKITSAENTSTNKQLETIVESFSCSFLVHHIKS